MKVLSLFDGMSCGLQALKELGIKIDEYHAFENDKYAIQISQKNHPEVIRHGEINLFTDFTQFKGFDLIIGGSPCQGFSYAGKQLNFSDPRSQLFFEFVRALKEAKPKYFLLENVRMKKEYLDVISESMCVQPVFINSALVSAQNRQRYYWCNWKVEQPKDRGLLLKDIIEYGDVGKEHTLEGKKLNYILNRPKSFENKINPDKTNTLRTGYGTKCGNETYLAFVDRDKSYAVDANYAKGGSPKQYFEKSRRQLVFTGGAMRGRYNEYGTTEQQLEVQETGKANALTSVQKDSLCIQVGEADINAYEERRRVYSVEGKSPAILTPTGGYSEKKISTDNVTWRKLTPIECERLQTLPDNYTEGVSNSQRYKMLGNGWTVEVIKHILATKFQLF